MTYAYPTTYRDAHGEIVTTTFSTGTSLRIDLDGVGFVGTDFDTLESADPSQNLARFTTWNGCLCDFSLDVDIDAIVVMEGTGRRGTLRAEIVLGSPQPNGALDQESVRLILTVDAYHFESRGGSGWFEDELLDIQRALPDDWHLKMCFGCAHSDYSYAGHGLFGSMLCFRGNKAAYARVKTKLDFVAIATTATEAVQETHLCPEFAVRKPDTGYRG